MGFPKQEYGSGLPFPFPGDLPNPGIEPVPPALAGGFFTTEPSGKSQVVSIFKKKRKRYYLFLVALGLRCRVLAFFSWGDGASHCGGSSCGRAWIPGHVGPAVAHTGFAAPWHVESSQSRVWTRVLCIGREMLNHWATREVPVSTFLAVVNSASVDIQVFKYLSICFQHFGIYIYTHTTHT